MSGHVVVGCVNMDLAVRTTRLPRPGETLLARSFHRSQGGKGANQAVGASRAGGAQVSMVGAVGRDADGEAHSCRPWSATGSTSGACSGSMTNRPVSL